MFIRRLGQSAINLCESGHNCPQILEMTNGNLAVVGLDIREKAVKAMPPGAGVGSQEGVVEVPRAVVIAAMIDLLKAA
jgi:hypothetical protein